MPLQSALPGVWQIPASIRSRVGDSPGRQRVIFEESHLLLVLHHPPQAGVMQRQGRFLWRRPDGQWTSNDAGDGPAVLAKHLEDYAKSIHRYDQLEEKAATADEYFEVIEGVLPLIRSTSHLHQVLQEARKLIPDDRGLINARDQAYELERTVDLLYSAAKNGLDFEVAKKAGEEARSSRNMARSAHRLNILAAFFFPLATASSVLGMELETARQTWPQAATVVVAGLLGGSLLALFVARNGRSNQSSS